MKKLLFSLMAVALAIGLMGGAFAYFTDSAASTANSFTAGTLRIDVNENGGGDTFVSFGNIGGLAPGEFTDPIEIKVENAGSLPAATFARFFFPGVTDLGPALKIYDWQVKYFNGNGSPNTRWGDLPTDNDPYFGTAPNEDYFVKDGVYSPGGFNMGLNILSIDAGDVIVSDRAWDAEALPKDGYYILKVRFQMDPLAGNEYQGKTCQVGFQVYATQVNAAAIDALGITLGHPGITAANWFTYFKDVQLAVQYP